MTSESLIKMAGAAALLGGGARIVASFIPWSPGEPSLEALYAAIDMLLLLGLVGLYGRKSTVLGAPGLVAFIVAVCSFSFIGGPDADPFGFSTYQVGAAVLALAMASFGAVALVRRAMPPWAPIGWIASLLAGLLAAATGGASGLAAAGVLFGAGFTAAGLAMMRETS